nr:immunoglobulin heavy chain junction region [Mus musculus]
CATYYRNYWYFDVW